MKNWKFKKHPNMFLQVHMLSYNIKFFIGRISTSIHILLTYLLLTFRFLTSGDSMYELSQHYGIPYQSMPIIVREICKTISRHLMPMVMPTPTTRHWERNAREFKRKYDMPNCVAALEGKNLFVNGHKIVFLALVDARDRFIMVDVGNYRLHSFRGNVMDRSHLGRSFLKNDYDMPAPKPLTENSEPLPHMILASSFFPPRPYLMTKYSRPECAVNESNRVFNTRLSRAKGTVNRALMRLRSKWGVFQGPLNVPVSVVETIVQTCCCLYNYFDLRVRLPPIEFPDEVAAITDERLDSLLKMVPEDSPDVRDKFKSYFLSPEGQVPWQWQDILTD